MPKPAPDEDLAASLLADGVLDRPGLERARAVAADGGIGLDRTLLRLGLIEEPALLQRLARVMGLEYVADATRLRPSRGMADALGLAYLRRKGVVPVAGDAARVTVLCADPGDAALRDEIEFQLERPVDLMVAPSRAIKRLLDGLDDPALVAGVSAEQADADRRALAEDQRDGPVIAFVAALLQDATAQDASDVHFAAADAGIDVRFRLNGVLVRQTVRDAVDPSAVFARIKVMSGMNVAERRKPQDGRMTHVIGGRVVDFRVSSMPTQQGESIVVRVLDPRTLRLGWERLGFDPAVETGVRDIVEQPSGLFLVTGPTGSGKTTTLYTALNHLRSERRKIISIEDPVEYQLPDIEQVQVNEAVGLDFSSALRAILRQDPNVIMVGEIRDGETAQIACRAALVGRMVLSTLHTNSAEGALTRLVDLGVEEFIVRDVLRGVLSQELALSPCPDCSGAGCPTCGGTGTGPRRLRARLVRF